MAEPSQSARDIAAHLRDSKDAVYTWIAEKTTPVRKVGHHRKLQPS